MALVLWPCRISRYSPESEERAVNTERPSVGKAAETTAFSKPRSVSKHSSESTLQRFAVLPPEAVSTVGT